ncbi:hypothetical protein [Chondromyces crocatus]|uniref:Secreted protein n=1 Tax=Chondromyces crocatus TaxID=52 RepID=A0A0K1ELS2_CHOCO|nr:hypothetical protein [Chondromyces crocatus]AKT41776.1 uncharacterized protein CMC5_059870 [Chondromyces crocatus]
MKKTRWIASWVAAMVLGAGLASAQPPTAAQQGGAQGRPGAGDARGHGERGGKPGEGPGPGRSGEPRAGEPPSGGKNGEQRPGEWQGKPGEAGQGRGERGEKAEGTRGQPGAARGQEDGEHAKRRKTQVDKERPALDETLKTRPMDEALKKEMQSHAERVARLERIQTLAEASGDTATAARAKALLEQENARYKTYLNNRK